LTLNGSIVETNVYSLVFGTRNNGNFVVGGSNSFSGGVTIMSGNGPPNVTVTLNNPNALNGTAGSENAVTFMTPNTVPAILSLNGQTVVVSQLNCGSGTNGIVQNASATPATLTVGNSKNLSSMFNGLIRDGTGGGALRLTKAGTGTLTLANTNIYTGVTTVNAGTLVMTNAVASTNWVIATNSTLSVNGAVALGGKTLTIATQGTAAGLLSVSGNLTLGGSLTVTAGSDIRTAVKIAECTGTVNGDVGDIAATLPARTYLEKRSGDTQLWLVPKTKGTLIRVF
jgi:autotransporter-associated beta strand protein